MFYTIFSNKDCTITNSRINGVDKSNTNTGASEILELYCLTSSIDNRGISRILINFDVSELSSSVADGKIPSDSKYRLFLKNAAHMETNPYSFHIEVCPLLQSFAEGRGLSMNDEGLKDVGVANWGKATSIVDWNISGSSYMSASNMTASQYFETGYEDLDIDITNIVGMWLTGGLNNNGLVIKFPQEYENSEIDFYVKKFYARNAHMPERHPKLNVLWNSANQDDRKNMFYDTSGNLFYYRINNGVPSSVGSLFVDVYNSSSLVQTLSADYLNDGVYKVSGVNVSPGSLSSFNDVWYSGTNQYFTGNFEPKYNTGSQGYNYENIILDFPNLRSYQNGEKVIIRVFIREKDYSPAIVSKAGSKPVPLFMKNAYYQIQNAETEEVIVGFSTGSLEYSKLSYDQYGNYFELWTDSLKTDFLYKIKIMVMNQNKKQIFDREAVFKINR